MAISLDLSTSQFGVPFSGAYFRVVTASYGYQRNGQKSVMIDVAGYATKPKNDDTAQVDFRRYWAAYGDVEACEGGSFVDKCYAWVMKQADMEGSVGC